MENPNKGTAVYYCDTESEFNEQITEYESNPDFTLLGYYNMINDIYDETEYQGFTEDQTRQLTHNRYGNCLEIIEYASDYVAFFGNR